MSNIMDIPRDHFNQLCKLYDKTRKYFNYRFVLHFIAKKLIENKIHSLTTCVKRVIMSNNLTMHG